MEGIGGLEITIARGRPVVPLPEGDRYLGFCSPGAPAPRRSSALREAHSRLRVRIAAAPDGERAGVG